MARRRIVLDADRYGFAGFVAQFEHEVSGGGVGVDFVGGAYFYGRGRGVAGEGAVEAVGAVDFDGVVCVSEER